jgi:Flp pilus assembly pilin Flp
MQKLMEILEKRVHNEQGAEIVEWVLWVGGIAILAGVLYTTVSGALNTKVSAIVNGISGVASS